MSIIEITKHDSIYHHYGLVTSSPRQDWSIVLMDTNHFFNTEQKK